MQASEAEQRNLKRIYFDTELNKSDTYHQSK